MSAHQAHFDRSDIERLDKDIQDLRHEIREKRNGGKYVVWVNIIVSTLTALLLATAIPWVRWVTGTINTLEATDASFKQWQSQRDTVLKLNQAETLQKVSEMIQAEIGKVSGKLDTINQQTIDNGYQTRRLGEMLQFHLDESKRPKTSGLDWRTSPILTNVYHVPTGGKDNDELYLAN